VAAVVDATVFDPGCAKRRRPVAVAELLQVDVAATCSGEQEWRIEARRKATSASTTRARSDTRRRCRELYAVEHDQEREENGRRS
jgi:hypothetical protein